MQRIVFDHFGDPSVLRSETVPMPVPGPGELLLNITCSGVNYADTLRRRDRYFMPTPLPYAPGSEAVGQVLQRGPGTPGETFPDGQRVLAILADGGGYAEAVTAPAAHCVPLPDGMDDRSAVALFVTGSTAWLLVHDVAGPLEGRTVLVHGAAGGVGTLLVQLAVRAGAHVIAGVGSERKREHALGSGAQETVNYGREGWAQRLSEAAGPRVDVVFDMVGGKVCTESLDALVPGGRMVVFGSASGEDGLLVSERFVDRNLTLAGFNLAHYIRHRNERWREALGAMMRLVGEGHVRVPVHHAYPLSDAARAHADVENRVTTGKVVLIP